MKNFEEINRTFTVKKTNLFNRVLWLMIPLLTIFATNVWGETVTLTYNYDSDYNDMWYGNMEDASSFWKITGTALFSVPISRQPTSNITITISIAYFGNGTEHLEKISAKGTESGSNWTLAETSPASHSGSTYVSSSFTITKNANPTTLGGLDITFNNKNGKKLRIQSVQVSYTADAACSGDPTIGTASLSGNFNSGGVTSLTNTVAFSTTSCSAYSGCAWTDYGFVWNTSTSPTTSNNKMQKGTSGTATSWEMTSPSTFSVGNTYYVRAYGKNGKAGATFKYSSSTMSFTPRSVTFNSNGGSAVSTKYIKSGGTITAPTAPTKTGYTFGGWYTDAELGSAVSWSSTITSNKIYYAKWTVKTTTVSFNQNSGTGGQTSSVTATYGSAMPTPITTPTRDGYTFGGYYDGSGGTGTKYYNADGSSAKNWDKENSTYTLYAKWTPNQYTVTWMSNGSTARTDNNVNHGSSLTPPTISPLPCGDKLAGWTDAAGGTYVHGTSTLYTSATITITANKTFYAVFADYDD